MAVKKTLSIILSLALWTGPLGCPQAAAKFGVHPAQRPPSWNNAFGGFLGWAGTPAGHDLVSRLDPALFPGQADILAYDPMMALLSWRHLTPEAADQFLKRLEGVENLPAREQKALVQELSRARVEASPAAQARLQELI